MVLNRYSVQVVKEQTAHYESLPEVTDPASLYYLICEALGLDKKLQEEVHVIMFNAKMKPIGSALIGMGGLTTCQANLKGEEPKKNWKICGGDCEGCICAGIGCWMLRKGQHVAFDKH